jgi:predicted nucleic-acid-binding protein
VTAVDTNVIVRLLTRDDEAQFQKARKIFSSHDVFIPNTVLMETEWVLRFAYRFEPTEISMSFPQGALWVMVIHWTRSRYDI